MYRQTRLAADAASTQACVHDVEPPPLVTLIKKPPPEPPAHEAERSCRACGEIKPLKLVKKSGKGHARICKACDNQRSRDRYYAVLAEHPSRFTGNFTFLDEFEELLKTGQPLAKVKPGLSR